MDHDCRELGDAAEDRFNSTEGGFVPGDPNVQAEAYTLMTEEAPGVWTTVDDNVYVNEAYIGDYVDSGTIAEGLVAHEEQHHAGLDPWHSGGVIECEVQS